MKRTTGVLVAALALFGLAMMWNFRGPATSSASSLRRSESSTSSNTIPEAPTTEPVVGSPKPLPTATPQKSKTASQSKSEPRAKNTVESEASESNSNSDDDGDDPDLPSGAGNVDKEAYLRARSGHLAMLRGVTPGVPFDPSLRDKAIRQMEAQEAQLSGKNSFLGKLATFFGLAPASVGVAWAEIGPAPLPAGSTTNSGRTTAIAVHPTNPNIAYVGTAQGGVYRTLNGGSSWTQLFDSAQSLAIGSIAIATSDPSIVYVGTGEPQFSGDSFFGVGLYRINNAETTADLFGPINNGTFTGRSISKVLVHPSSPDIVFVSTTTGTSGNPGGGSVSVPSALGLYRSENATSGLASFVKLTVTATDRNIVDMVFEPGNPNTLICTVRSTSADGGVYRTTNALDAAPTFTQTLTVLEGSSPASGRAELAINNVGGVVTVLLASGELPTTSSCPSSSSGTLRKSTDGGQTWSLGLIGGNGFCGGQCFYNIAVAIDPTNANNVLLGGNVIGTCSRLIARSTNGGDSFVNTPSSNIVHADNHAVEFAPSNPLIAYLGNDGGIYKSTDGGSTWASLNITGFSATQFQSLALHPIDREFMIGGTQDNGTELRRPDQSWTRSEGGDGGYALIDQNATDTTNVTMYHTFFNNSTQIGFARSTNGGSSWPNRFGCVSSGSSFTANGITCSDTVLFYAPMALGPGNPNTLYFGTDRLYRSSDRGASMTVVSQAPLTSPTSAFTTIGISPQDDNVRIVGTRSGRVFATTTGANPMTEVTNGSFPASRAVGRAVIDPNNPNIAYVTFGGYGVPANRHVWKTTNLAGGAGTWVESGNGIPDVPVNAFVVDPQNSLNVFAGTDIGVYNSTDGGANWTPYGTGLPRVAVFDIAIQSPSRILRIATHGRGIWEITVTGTPAPSPSPTPTPTPPANDNFANAQVLPGCSGTVNSSNVNATRETGEPSHDPLGSAGGGSLWYQWTAPVTGSVNFTTAGSDYDTVLAIYTGDSFGAFTVIGKSDDVQDGVIRTSTLTFTAAAGTIYKIAVDGWNGERGNVTLNWSQSGCTAVPPTIQMEFATYNFSEGVGNAQVHVKRTGDTTAGSSVNFSTGGNSFFSCDTINGSAVQNCDFTLNQGTLAFAAGQTDRSINILINDDTYVEGNETLTVTLSSPVGATLGSPGSATLTLNDNDTVGATVPAPKTFIAALNAAQEVPPTGTSGKGGGLVQLDGPETGGKAGLLFSSLSSAETAAHIHGAAPIGTNAPILFPLPTGTVNDFAISPTSQQVADLKAGLHYMNVHSNNFLNGEIRGQLLWNPLNEVDYFVTQHYYDFLGRLPDQSGFDFWTNEIRQCGINVQCFRDKSVDVSNAFFYEQEYQQTASYVFLLYRAAYGNTQPFPNPDPANPTEANKLPRYLTFVRDRAQVVGGTNLAASQKALADAFVQRAEFTTRYPLSLTTGAQFVDAVLATINTADGATFAAADRTALITHFNNGGRGLVMFHLANDYWNGCNRLPGSPPAPCVPGGYGAAVDNRVFIDAEYNRSFVYSQYSGYLRRDGDINGFIFWLNQVSAAPPRNVAKQHAMVCSFITSAEYQLRFGSKSPRTNAECTP